MMICSMCGLKSKGKSQESTDVYICKACCAYLAQQQKYNQLLRKIFKNDPTLKEAVA